MAPEYQDQRMKIRVIGCGNPLMGNDAVGIRIIERLEREFPDIDVVEGGVGGMGLIPLMEGYDAILIVDATTGFGKPGDIHVFSDDIPSSEVFPMSLHDFGLAEALEMAGVIGVKPHIVIIAIEGGEINEFSPTMDPVVESAMEIAYQKVLDELEKIEGVLD
jgi:hydrogenase maturation protease